MTDTAKILAEKSALIPAFAAEIRAAEQSGGVPSQTNTDADALILIAGRPVWEVGQDIVRLMTRMDRPTVASVNAVALAPEAWDVHVPSFVAGFVAAALAVGSVAVAVKAGL